MSLTSQEVPPPLTLSKLEIPPDLELDNHTIASYVRVPLLMVVMLEIVI